MTPIYPSGTVTFLFTDIEGSTQRWEQFPQAMRNALLRHDQILRFSIESHQGYVFKTIGDAFCAAFSNALDALQAALTAQRTLLGQEWDPQIQSLPVRIVLHTGQAEEQQGDYLGPTVNRANRLLSAGHGGQILVSHPTRQLLEDRLPAEVELLYLGEHRLKDLSQPESICQVIVPDLPSQFPPLRTLEIAPVNLPAQPTSFVGRATELAEIRQLLDRPEVRLVSLTGPGGTGKTRLSLQLAAELSPQFEGGVHFVGLAGVREASLVLPTIAQTLGLKENDPRSLPERLADFWQGRSALLVLDNFEQVVEAGNYLAELMQTTPNLKLLVSSREVLKIYGEYEYPVPPLALPDPHQPLPPPTRLLHYEAIRLFTERTQAVRPGFSLNGQNAVTVVEICRRLDGLPLAIELAAARCKLFTPEVLLARLDQRLKILTGGSVNLPLRQQTLRGTLDWSYDLLDQNEKSLFERLGLFAGGASLEAVETVCWLPQEAEWDILEGLQSLVDKSLLRLAETPASEPLFTMLNTVREYALTRLAVSPQASSIQEQFLDYYCNLADTSHTALQSAEQSQWLDRLEQEHANLQATLELTWQNSARLRKGLQLAGTLRRFWAVRGYLSLGRQLLSELLKRSSGERSSLPYIKVLDGAGTLARLQGDLATAADYHRQALQISEELGDHWAMARSYYNLGIVALYQTDLTTAEDYLQKGLTLSRTIGDLTGQAQTLNGLGNLALERQEYPRARPYYSECLTLYRRLGDKRGIAGALNNLGLVEMSEARYPQATTVYAESVALNRELGDKYGTAMALHNLGLMLLEQNQIAAAGEAFEESLLFSRELNNLPAIANNLTNLATIRLHRGDPIQARLLLRESLQLQVEHADYGGVVETLAALANVASAEGQLDQAARLFGLLQKVCEVADLTLDEATQAVHAENMARLREALDQPDFETAWQEGYNLAVPAALGEAIF